MNDDMALLMRKAFLYYILPAVLVLLFCLIYLAFYILQSNNLVLQPEQGHRVVLICIISIIALALITYFSWKCMYKIGGDINKITQVAKNLKESFFAQRFSYDSSSAPDLVNLRSALNNLVAKIEKRQVKLHMQINEKMAVLSSMSEAVIAVNLNENVYIFNQAAQEIFSSLGPDEDLNSKTLASLIRVPEVYKLLSESVEAKQNIEKSLFLKDAYVGRIVEELHLNIKSSAVYDRKKNISGMVFVIKDITKVKKLEKHRTNFVGNVSHELKTPLTLIQGFSETLLNDNDFSKEDVKKYIGIIHKHSSRLGALINDLLSISKLESEESSKLELESLPAMIVVKSAISLCQEKAKERRVLIRLVDDMKSPLKIKMNYSLLEQAIVNLIDNAVKHSSEGSEVVVSTCIKENNFKIEVIDSGCGMEEKHLSRIFERFYRVDKGRSRDVGGTGLGLSIVKHVVSLHSGLIHVDSQTGKGSNFSISLPK